MKTVLFFRVELENAEWGLQTAVCGQQAWQLQMPKDGVGDKAEKERQNQSWLNLK